MSARVAGKKKKPNNNNLTNKQKTTPHIQEHELNVREKALWKIRRNVFTFRIINVWNRLLKESANAATVEENNIIGYIITR